MENQVSEEQMSAWKAERAAYAAKMVEGFPQEFGLVFHQDVGMAGCVASSDHCAYDFVGRSKPVEELRSWISYRKQPHNPNSREPSALPDFIKFTYKIAQSEGRDHWDFSLTACLSILATYAEDPACFAVIKDFAGNMTTSRYENNAVMNPIAAAREAWIDVMTRFFEKGIRTMSHHGIDDETKFHMTRALAHRLWEKEGKPVGKQEQHWKDAETKVNAIVSLSELGELDTLFALMDKECREKIQRDYKR